MKFAASGRRSHTELRGRLIRAACEFDEFHRRFLKDIASGSPEFAVGEFDSEVDLSTSLVGSEST